MAAPRIIILNWKWSDKLAYPTFTASREATNNLIQFENQFKFLPASRKENVEEKANTFILKDGQSDRYILPTKVDLSPIDDGSDNSNTMLANLQEDYFEKVSNACGNFCETKQLTNCEYIFLFHSGNGFDDVNKLLEILEDPNKKFIFQSSRIGFFGKGTGVIYEENGFLPLGMPAFRFKEGKVGWFKKDVVYELVILKLENFDFIWNHYWFMTQKRLSEFRKLLFAVQLPTAETSLRQVVLLLARNLLAVLDKGLDNPQSELREIIGWDFSDCGDLSYWISKKNKDLEEKYICNFKDELQHFMTNHGELPDYSLRNIALGKIMSSFLN